MLFRLPRLAAFVTLTFSSLLHSTSAAPAPLDFDTSLALEPALSAFFPNPNGLTYSYTASSDFLCPPNFLIVVDAVFPVHVDVLAREGFGPTALRRLSNEEPEVLALIANNWTSTAVRWTFPPLGERRVIVRVLDAANNVVYVPRRLIPPEET